MNEYERLLFKEVNKRKPDIEIIKRLLKNGADINARDERGETALFEAIGYIGDIIWKDENGNLAETGDESIALVQIMVPKIDITIIKHLFELGADPNIENKYSESCIVYAVYTFRSDIFKLFLAYGADVNFKVDDNECFCDWIIGELHEFKWDVNDIAVEEISKMVMMLNEYKSKAKGG
ncbi:MAG: ankyrin repeat domain-containing protein [Spirochaetaceae bacterium]|jgi:ankyrin repeat protein|nr:ankyrin repeat domain-containing protein [Spirochaetaceae bacterium]